MTSPFVCAPGSREMRRHPPSACRDDIPAGPEERLITSDPLRTWRSRRPEPGTPSAVGSGRQLLLQPVPLSVKAAGTALLLVWSARQPTVTLVPGARVPSYEAFVAVTAPVAGAQVAPQPLVMA